MHLEYLACHLNHARVSWRPLEARRALPRPQLHSLFSSLRGRLSSHPTRSPARLHRLLGNLYNGHIYIWNYNDGTVVKSFEACELPVRTAKFVPRKQWIVCGCDDMRIRVYNYNTMEKVKEFEAHADYIR